MNYDHQGKRFAIAGMSGTGKTTFYLKAFRNWQASYKFAFDRKREIARKLRLKTCVNVEQMKYAVLHRYPVLFDSAEMFPGQPREGFAWFCQWTYEVCKLLRGVKLFACDEIQFVVPLRRSIPLPFMEILDDGRKEEIDCLFVVNKGYNKLHDDIRAQISTLYVFRTVEVNALKLLASDGVDVEKVRNLKMPVIGRSGGEFITHP